jgi:hypocretin (orexin) receptor 2
MFCLPLSLPHLLLLSNRSILLIWIFFIFKQTVSVTVSILTLTFISIDRWYAICFPLKYKPHPGRAIIWIIVIWTAAILSDLPEFFVAYLTHYDFIASISFLFQVLHIDEKPLRFDMKLFTQCVPSWDAEAEMYFNSIKAVFLYTYVKYVEKMNLMLR